VISEHSSTYLPCFDHPYDWDNADFDAVSSARSVVQVEVAEDGLILTGWMPDTATVTITATARDGSTKTQSHPVTVQMALDAGVTQCSTHPTVNGPRLTLRAFGVANIELADVTVTAFIGPARPFSWYVTHMPKHTRAEWSLDMEQWPHDDRAAVRCTVVVTEYTIVG
jgi:hypothetical protein